MSVIRLSTATIRLRSAKSFRSGRSQVSELSEGFDTPRLVKPDPLNDAITPLAQLRKQELIFLVKQSGVSRLSTGAMLL